MRIGSLVVISLLFAETAIAQTDVQRASEAFIDWFKRVVHAPGWGYLASTEPDGMVVLIKDLPAGAYPQAQIRTEYRWPRKTAAYNSFSYESALAVFEINCAKRQTRVTKESLYADNNLAGAARHRTTPGSWLNVARGGADEILVKRICEN